MNYIGYTQDNDFLKNVNLGLITFRESILTYLHRDGKSIKSLLPEDKLSFNEISRKFFESRTLAQNRELAVKMGVYSPCTYSKSELIDLLMTKLWKLQHYDSSDEQHKPIDPSLISEEIEMNVIQDALCSDFIIGEEVTGLYEELDKGGIIRIDTFTENILDVYVIDSIAKMYDLRAGDIVKGRFYYNREIGFNLLYFVNEKADCIYKRSVIKNKLYKIKNYNCLPLHYNFSCSKDSFNYYGQACIIDYNSIDNLSNVSCNCLDYFNKNNCFDIILPVILGQNQILCDNISRFNKSFQCIISNSTNKNINDGILKRTSLYAWAQAKLGRNVVVLLCGSGGFTISRESGFCLEKLFSSTGVLKYNGSVSCVCISNTIEFENKALFVSPCVDCIIKLQSINTNKNNKVL